MFWGIIGLRYQSGYEIWADTAYTGTAITLNWFCAMCWFFLILEGKQNKKQKQFFFDFIHFFIILINNKFFNLVLLFVLILLKRFRILVTYCIE